MAQERRVTERRRATSGCRFRLLTDCRSTGKPPGANSPPEQDSAILLLVRTSNSMSSPLGFRCNPSVVNSSAPPYAPPRLLGPRPISELILRLSAARSIPAAAVWASKYAPTSDPSSKLINLSQGVPGSPPPVELLARLAEQAGDPSTTTYGPIAGDADLKRALAADITKVYGAEEGRVSSENVAITAGCNLVRWGLRRLRFVPPGLTLGLTDRRSTPPSSLCARRGTKSSFPRRGTSTTSTAHVLPPVRSSSAR